MRLVGGSNMCTSSHVTATDLAVGLPIEDILVGPYPDASNDTSDVWPKDVDPPVVLDLIDMGILPLGENSSDHANSWVVARTSDMVRGIDRAKESYDDHGSLEEAVLSGLS